MTLFGVAIDPQQAATEAKNRISGCSSALPGRLWDRRVRLNFLSSRQVSNRKVTGNTSDHRAFDQSASRVRSSAERTGFRPS